MEDYIKFLKQVYDFYIFKSKRLWQNNVSIVEFNEYYTVDDNYIQKYLNYLRDKNLLECGYFGCLSILPDGVDLIEKTFYIEKYIARFKSMNSILSAIYSHPNVSHYILASEIYDSLNMDRWFFYDYLKYLHYHGYAKEVGNNFVQITSTGIDAVTNNEFDRLISEITADKSIPIYPDKPFDNEYWIKDLINTKSHNQIYWLDKYFTIASLNYLADYLDSNKINAIEIITNYEQIDDQFRSTFKKLSAQINPIKIKINVMIDKKKMDLLHDRYFITFDKFDILKVYNIPSADVIKRGQMSDIKIITRDNIMDEYNQFKEGSLDLISDWNRILEIKNKAINKENKQ